MYPYIKKSGSEQRTYCYLILEQHISPLENNERQRRVQLLGLPVDDAIKPLLCVVAVIEEQWCGGWDLNPRRPTPSGPKPSAHPSSHTLITLRVNYVDLQRLVDNRRLKGFHEWCLRSASEEQCKGYIRYLQKPLNPSNRWSVTAWKRFLRWMCEQMGLEDACRLFRAVKSKRSRPDSRVPSTEEALQAVDRACRSSEALCWTYRLLLYSGMRLDEVTKVLSTQRPELWVEFKPGLYRYPIDWERGTKDSYQLYSIEVPPRLTVSAKWVSNWASKHRLLSPKYVRKIAATKMYELALKHRMTEIESTIDFIQGRIPRKVLSRHYLRLITLADTFYPIYAEWLRGAGLHGTNTRRHVTMLQAGEMSRVSS